MLICVEVINERSDNVDISELIKRTCVSEVLKLLPEIDDR